MERELVVELAIAGAEAKRAPDPQQELADRHGHSARSASAGSMRSARRTGSSARARATAISTTARPRRSSGSIGLTPKTSVSEKRVLAAAPGEAGDDAKADECQPARQHEPQHVEPLRAERHRTPTSRVRSATPYDTTP